MRVCIPVREDRGLQSTAYGHFGSALYFLIFETRSHELHAISNKTQDHEHGACSPLDALAGEDVEAVIVGGIGSRALAGLKQMGVKTYQSKVGTVEENLNALDANGLHEMSAQHACSGHGHDHP